jgi:hypothetical protein
MRFGRVCYINLDSSVDRRQSFEQRIAAIEWPCATPERVLGICEEPPSWWTSQPAAWGVWRAHEQIYHHAMMYGLDSVLVFEDDAVFLPDFQERFNRFMAAVPADWDLIYLGGNHHDWPEVVNGEVLRCMETNATHAYAIRRSGILQLYKLLLEKPEALHDDNYHADTVLATLQQWRKVNAYCPWYWMVGQAAGVSDRTGLEIPEDWFFQPDEQSLNKLREGIAC